MLTLWEKALYEIPSYTRAKILIASEHSIFNPIYLTRENLEPIDTFFSQEKP